MSEEDWFERAIESDDDAADPGSSTKNGAAPDAASRSDTTGTDGSAGLFDDDFAAEFSSMDIGDLEGLEPDNSAFSEPIDSNIPRVDLGVDGLDEMIQGGVPERSLISVIGAAGTGKTTFGLQFIRESLADGERAIFITLEQTREEIEDTAAEFGWSFDEYIDTGDLVIVDMDPVEMANSLGNIQNELPDLIADFDASRLVLDSVSLLEMMYDGHAKRRNEIYAFTRSLKDSGVTTLLTSEAGDRTESTSRFGIVEYLTDAVITLRMIRTSDFREARLAIEIQKIRNTNHSRETKPYSIGEEGITVYRHATIF